MKFTKQPNNCPQCNSTEIFNFFGPEGHIEEYRCKKCDWKAPKHRPKDGDISEPSLLYRPEKCPNCNSAEIYHDCGVPKHKKANPYCTECEVPGSLKGNFVCDDCSWGANAETGEAIYSGDVIYSVIPDVNEPQKVDTGSQVNYIAFLNKEQPTANATTPEEDANLKQLKRNLEEKKEILYFVLKNQIKYRFNTSLKCCKNCFYNREDQCTKWDPLIFKNDGYAGHCDYFDRPGY
jgi:hypothetical protein